MKILEHTSTHLTLQNSAIVRWLATLLFCVFLILFIWGTGKLEFSKIIESLYALALLIFFYGIGLLFASKRTFYFDKILNLIKIRRS